MSYTVEHLSPLLVKIQTIVDSQSINSLVKQYGKNENTVNERSFEIINQVTNYVVNDILNTILKKEFLEPFKIIEFLGSNLVIDSEYTFSVVFETLPQIDFPHPLSSIELQLPPPVLPPKVYENIVHQIRKKHAILTECMSTESPENGDIVKIQTCGKIEGIPAPCFCSSREDFEINADEGKKNKFGLNISTLVKSMHTGETKSVVMTTSPNIPDIFLRGKKVEFSITLLDVKHMKLPVVNDELARIEGFNSIDEMTKAVQKIALNMYLKTIRQEGKKQLVEYLVNNKDFPIPESLEKYCFKEYINDAKRILESYGIQKDKLVHEIEKIKVEALSTAKEQAKREVILLVFAAHEHLFVGEEELKKYIDAEAKKNKKQYNNFYALLNKNELLQHVHDRILIDKALNHAYDLVTKKMAAQTIN